RPEPPHALPQLLAGGGRRLGRGMVVTEGGPGQVVEDAPRDAVVIHGPVPPAGRSRGAARRPRGGAGSRGIRRGGGRGGCRGRRGGGRRGRPGRGRRRAGTA